MTDGKVHRLLRIGLKVRALQPAIDFYAQALGFVLTPQTQVRTATLRLGDQTLELVETTPEAEPYPRPRAANDPWFQHFAIAVNDMDRAYAQLAPHLVKTGAPGLGEAISHGAPVLLPPSTGSVTAFKFRDPDGHPLELSLIPASDWMRAPVTEGPFLGIDHTAVAIADLQTSLQFWRDRLGLQLKAQLVNQGPEQARLDGLEAPVVDIAVLQFPAGGPHVELLRYRSPTPPAPRSIDDGDIAATFVVLEADGPTGETLQDPDGHRVRVVAPDGLDAKP